MLGGNFGVWGGLFSTFDCAVKGVRHKEDPYNASMFPASIRIRMSRASRGWNVLTRRQLLQDSLLEAP